MSWPGTMGGMMRNVIRVIRRQPRSLLTALGFVLVLCLGVIDYLTGPEISFSVFYLLPILGGTWFVDQRAGIFLSIFSAATWLAMDLLAGATYSHSAIPYWNAATRLTFFLIVATLVSALKRRLEHEEELARKDALTGMSNVRFFIELASMEIGRARRYQHPFTLLYIDADNFKSINDRFGHNTGDALLRSMAEVMKGEIRATDVVARLGGDEFVILLPETGYEPAQRVICKVRQHLLDTMAEEGWSVTFSIGAVTFTTPPDSVQEMIKQADDLMYAAKRNGKDMAKHVEVGLAPAAREGKRS
jgi:diguanylate cyclase (GGDEF)-like protein